MRVFAIIAIAVASLLPAVSAGAPPASGAIANQYIITYKPEYVNNSLVDVHESWLETSTSEDPALVRRDDALGFFPKIKFGGFKFLRRYKEAATFRGYSAVMTAEIAEQIKALPEVEAVEQDVVMSITAVQTNPAAWGLKRISKAALPLPADYTYPNAAGAGVNIYVIDSGVQVSHPEFGGRASNGPNFSTDSDTIDRSGHGTHVAGTAAGATYGVAKRANIVSVKVFGASGSGSNSDVIAAVNWVAANGPRSGRPCVVNMSLGGPVSAALDSAVAAGVRAGCTFAVAAGNAGGNSCINSPARAPTAFTVAASDINDRIASFSDRGTCVDIIAPGAGILSSWIGSTTRTISGTSMASPHVAGVFALAISNGVSSTPATLMNYVRSIGVANRITGLTTSTRNLLLQAPRV